MKPMNSRLKSAELSLSIQSRSGPLPVVRREAAIEQDEREEQDEDQSEGAQYEVDITTGIVKLSRPPEVGEPITAGFEFDVPVRFDSDRIQTSLASFQAGDVPNVPVVEVRI